MAGPSKGSKPDKILRDALILELNREDLEDGKKIKRVSRIVHKLVAAGVAGEIAAIKEIFDRVEGRPAQAIIGDVDNPLSVIHRLERAIIDPNVKD